MDFLSSVVVLWRFFAPWSLDDALERKLQSREERASMAISFIMVLLGFFIISSSVADASRGREDAYEYALVWSLAFLSFFVFGILTALKLRFAKKLECDSLYKDGLCSLIGTALSFAIVITTLIAAEVPAIWWIDPFMAFIAGMVALALGMKAMYDATTAGKRIFTLEWWKTEGPSSGEEENGIESNNKDLDLDVEVVELPNGATEDREVV